jgi:hypothetical protein
MFHIELAVSNREVAPPLSLTFFWKGPRKPEEMSVKSYEENRGSMS